MNIGYARVSKDIQDLERQVSALEAAGCERIVREYKSGAKVRPELEGLLSTIQAGDTLVICKLDRFGRSLIDLLGKIENLVSRGIGFRSLGDSFDITTANGRLMLHVLAAVAEYERELIRERVRDGLRQARANGSRLGRPKGIVDQGLVDQLRGLQGQGMTRQEIQERMNIKKGKYYRLVNGSGSQP